jgi:hypothetical protein
MDENIIPSLRDADRALFLWGPWAADLRTNPSDLATCSILIFSVASALSSVGGWSVKQIKDVKKYREALTQS